MNHLQARNKPIYTKSSDIVINYPPSPPFPLLYRSLLQNPFATTAVNGKAGSALGEGVKGGGEGGAARTPAPHRTRALGQWHVLVACW